jgi:hypothetical protein
MGLFDFLSGVVVGAVSIYALNRRSIIVDSDNAEIRMNSGMANVTVNGVSYTGYNSVSVSSNGVIIDNEMKDSHTNFKIVKININGDVSSVNTASSNVDVTGNITGNVKTMSGNVRVGKDVHGRINTISGSVYNC